MQRGAMEHAIDNHQPIGKLELHDYLGGADFSSSTAMAGSTSTVVIVIILCSEQCCA